MLSVSFVSDQPRQIRLRLQPEVLDLASDLQRVFQANGEEHSLEAVVSFAIRQLHISSLPDKA